MTRIYMSSIFIKKNIFLYIIEKTACFKGLQGGVKKPPCMFVPP